MAQLRIALCQLNAVVGDLEGNTAKVLGALEEAEDSGAELAIFPELVLTGYPPEDLLLSPLFIAENRRALERVAQRSRRCVGIIGFVDRNRDLFNAAAAVANGEIRGIYHKELLPNYGVFDERRWFVPGNLSSGLLEIAGVRAGVAICEDAWTPTGPILRQAAGGAELVVVLNASPYRSGVLYEREAMLSTRAADASCALAYVNLVGGQDELVFDGASMVFDLEGKLVARAPQFEEVTLIVDLELGETYRKRLLEPRARPHAAPLPVITLTEGHVPRGDQLKALRIAPRLDPVEEVYEALVLATRDYVQKNGFEDVIVGLSGGVDSALVATIAADALGKEHVHAVAMPSRFSSPSSLEDATELSANLDIALNEIGIESVYAALLDSLSSAFGDRPSDLTEENLQARIRGVLLMALSNKFGWLVLTTGNKSETAVGYSTLYGDMAGGFSVIKDVPKTLVYQLCEMRNERAKTALIPTNILEKAPSAELREDQRDSDSLPPYETLDPILEGYVERGIGLEELVDAGFDQHVVARVISLVDRAEYKRRQAAPGPRVTSRAFGKDRRMPLTNRFAASFGKSQRPPDG